MRTELTKFSILQDCVRRNKIYRGDFVHHSKSPKMTSLQVPKEINLNYRKEKGKINKNHKEMKIKKMYEYGHNLSWEVWRAE